jgi:chloramphenicol 3-O phosphotransferase
MPPRIIILNGVGSVGKSSTARALQTLTAEPLLHVAMDAFIDMLPEAMIGHPDGLVFETDASQSQPSVMVRSGPVLERAMRGMRHAVAAQGNNLVVDEVMIGGDKLRDYRSLLSRFDMRLVGLLAPLEVLEARERSRGDRLLGLARWQYERVHQGMVYDLELDTSAATPLQTAQAICEAFCLQG